MVPLKLHGAITPASSFEHLTLATVGIGHKLTLAPRSCQTGYQGGKRNVPTSGVWSGQYDATGLSVNTQLSDLAGKSLEKRCLDREAGVVT